MEHPILAWAGAVVVVGTLLGTSIGAYLFLDGLRDSTDALHAELATSIAEKKALDKDWLHFDRGDHQNILDQGKAIQWQVKLLLARMGGDGSLLYQIGLRDGQALCKASEGR